MLAHYDPFFTEFMLVTIATTSENNKTESIGDKNAMCGSKHCTFYI